MSPLHPLNSQRGSSVVEFLICAPILALLTYAAYDLNRRIENQQTVTIAARNAVLMGDAFSQSQHETTLKKQLDVENQILDSQERQLVKNSAYVKVDAGHRLGEAGYGYGRIEAAPGVQTGGSSFDTLSQSTGRIGSTMGAALQGIQGTGEAIGLFIPDRIRSAAIETSAPGNSNAIQGAISVLASATTNDPKAKDQVLAVTRRFGQRFYLQQESGYHPNGHDSFDFAGVFVGMTKDRWGAGSKFSDSSSEIQTRCMTRFYGSDACGTGGDHEFYDQVRGIATGKMAVSTVLRVCEKAPIVGPICKAAIDTIQAITGAAVSGADMALQVTDAVGQLSDALDKGVPGFDAGFQGQFESPEVVDQFVSGMSPGQVPKVGG